MSRLPELGGDTGYSPNDPRAHHPQANGVPIQPFYDGLEVAPSSAPEWTGSSSGHESSLGHKIPAESPELVEWKKYPHAAGAAGLEVANGNGNAQRPWWRRKRVIGALIAIIVLVAVGLGVGLGVGLSGGSDSSGDSDEASKGSDSSGDGKDTSGDNGPCKNGFCDRVLATSLHQDVLFIFSRSSDLSHIAYTTYNGSWSDWSDLSTTPSSEILFAPNAQNWMVNASYWRMDLFAVGSGNKVYNNWKTDEEDWPGWEEIGDNVDGSVNTCSVHRKGYKDRLDLWSVETGGGNITKTRWYQREDKDIAEEGFEGITEANGWYGSGDGWYDEGELGSSKVSPAVTCALSDGDDERFHSIMWYEPDGSKAYHSSYTEENKWARAVDYPGSWIGSPVMQSSNSKRNDGYFFGVQSDHKMYHLSWDADHNFSDMDVIPGSEKIYSPPMADIQDDGETINVVALGEDGGLLWQHKTADGWADEWEDLDIKTTSAPMMRDYNGSLLLFALNEDGELMTWERDGGTSGSWRHGWSDGTNLGGDLSLEY